MNFTLLSGFAILLLTLHRNEAAPLSVPVQCDNLDAAQCKEEFREPSSDESCAVIIQFFKYAFDYALEKNEAKINELKPNELEQKTILEKRKDSLKKVQQNIINNRDDCKKALMIFEKYIKETNGFEESDLKTFLEECVFDLIIWNKINDDLSI